MTLNFSILSCILMVNGGLHFFVPHRATKMSGPALHVMRRRRQLNVRTPRPPPWPTPTRASTSGRGRATAAGSCSRIQTRHLHLQPDADQGDRENLRFFTANSVGRSGLGLPSLLHLRIILLNAVYYIYLIISNPINCFLTAACGYSQIGR